MVFGYASTPTRDLDGEVIELDAIKDALPGYMEWRNIREMHAPSAVGVAKEANVDEKGLYIGARIVDDDAWKKVIEEVYKGFSIGGNVTKRDGATITGLDLIEISLVDRPANPDCRIDVIKAAGTSPAKVENFSMAEAEAPQPGVMLDRDEVGFFGRIIAKLSGGTLAKGGDAPGDGSKPYGDVEYADPGYRDGQKRYPIDTEEHIRAAWSYIHHEKNAGEYTAEQLASIKRRIVAAWKKKIDEKGPPEAGDKAADEAAADVKETKGAHGAAQHQGGQRAAGEISMTDQIDKRAATGRHHEHLRKAMHHLEQAHKCAMAAMPREEKAADGSTILKAAGDFAGHMERLHEHHVLAHHHLAAGMGHKGEPGEQPGDAEAGIYKPEEGLTPLGQRHLTEGEVPAYAADRPYPGKAAEGTLTKREADALIEAAFLRGKVEALEKMPANPKARLFAVPRGSMPVSDTEEPTAREKLLKGVDLDAATPAERQAAAGRLIGNMIANSATFARPVLTDPTFRGGAAR